MEKIKIILIITIILGTFSTSNVTYGKEKLGLLIVAHGSPAPQWNDPVLKLEAEVKKIVSKDGNNPFCKIRVALMEFGQPTINNVIKDFEKAGVERTLIIPLFIAPSEHSLYDTPTILGLYSDKKMIESIEAEGIAIVQTKMKLTIGPTLYRGNVLKEIMLDRVKKFSIAPDSEGVVLLAHGSANFEPIWSSMCREIGFYICAKTGINYFDYAFVEVGQSFISEGMPVILKVARKCKRTLVLGLYLSMGVNNMAQNSLLRVGQIKIESKKIFANKNIYFSTRGILPDKRITEWIVNNAREWANRLK